MNANEILRASALDILFDGRNKSYGAYELRKHYHQRLTIAVMSAFLFAGVLILFFTGALSTKIIIDPIPEPKTDIIVRDVVIPPPVIEKPPVAPSPSTASAPPSSGSLAHIKMVDDNIVVDYFPPTPGSVSGDDGVEDPGFIPGPPSTGPVVSTIVASPTVREEVFKPEQKEPMFPGGKDAWLQFLMRHLQAPNSMPPGERITVMVRFIVEKDGSVNSFEVIRSGGSVFDKEVIRVLKKMPHWQPAVQNGRPVSVSFTQPVTFEAVEE